MDSAETLPTWSELFGSPDTKEADAGRSVTGPAAYLADLLQLLADRFDPSDVRSRRPDISTQILLNGDESFSLVRQLDITNRVLGDRIASLAKTPAEDVLAVAPNPFLLPFEYQYERIRQLLLLLRTPYGDLYTSFTPHADVDLLARERLGLSPARAAKAVKDLSGDAAGLHAAYGLAPNETMASLAVLERLKRATDLDGPSLRTLLFLQLSQSSNDGAGVSERHAAGQLFINHDLGGYVALDDSEQQLVWRGESQQIPDAWFDRVHRLLCLSRWTGIDLASLDLVLRQLCHNTLDLNALRRLAVLVDLRERTGAAIEVLCALFWELDGTAALGAGDDPTQPASLFDRVFNGNAALLAKRYVPSGSAYLPEAYVGWKTLVGTGDWLSDDADNKALRVRIQKSLGISPSDLSAVVTRFRDRATARGRVSPLASGNSWCLSVLHRMVRLAEFAGLPPLELLRLVEVLEKDPSLKVLNAFNVLFHEDVDQPDLYEVLEQGPLEARSWLIQNIVAIGAWMGTAGLTPEDLDDVAVVADETDPEKKAALLATAQALHDAFLPTALASASLESAEITARAARVALGFVRDPARGLVSPLDARILTFDETKARAAANAAVRALDAVTVDDLVTLSLGEDLATYLQSLLVRRGLLDEGGILLEEKFPARASDFVLEPDGSARFNQIFDFLKGQYDSQLAESAADAAAGAGTDAGGDAGTDAATDAGADAGSDAAADIQLYLYPSDLLNLGFELSEADEWIERLTFLGILDSSSMVQDPSIFGDPENRGNVPISLGLDSSRADLYAQLAARRDRWLSAPLKLPDDIWDKLPLTGAERAALEQNLMFNGHIDTARRIVNRSALEALTPDTFDLALQFFRNRRLILAALQGVVESNRENYLKVGPDELRPFTDRFIAINALQALSDNYLDGRGRLGPDLLAQIDSAQPPIDLGLAYSLPQLQRIWSLLQQIYKEASKYRLTDAALASIDITDDDTIGVIVSLSAANYLLPDRSLTEDQVARFVNVNSAQDFIIPDYADYSRDVFFLVHDVAIAVDAAVTALITSLEAAADAQKEPVFEAIGDQLELSAEAAASIVQSLLRGERNVTAALVAPVLQAAGSGDTIEKPPRDRTFRTTIRRTRAFANYALKLGMVPDEIEVAFQDLQLIDKFPEVLLLPQGVDGIDCVWKGPDGPFYLFRGTQYWTFDAHTLEISELPSPLSMLCADFKNLPGVDAVYTLANGEHWFLAQGRSWRRTADSAAWVETPRAWGLVQSRFDDPANIDAALLDYEGCIHLFSGDQYIRYSNWPQEFVDEGYPRSIAAQWLQELGFGPFPPGWGEGIDAAVCRKDEVTWLFKADHYVASTEPSVERNIVDFWGHVRNNLASASRVDAVLDIGGRCGVAMGDQVSLFSNSLETEGLTADEGYPRTLATVFQGLPETLARGIDAGLTDEDRTIHLFLDQNCATGKGGQWASAPTRERWGRVRNTLQDTGLVDAALSGLDGKIYLFSGDQYVRYSGTDLSRVDEGYPKSISPDWGGLTSVVAAFVLDGKTYLFGSGPAANSYVRYSTRDYTIPDVGYPLPTDDNWWNLPVALVERHFNLPDGVFVAPDGRIHLFSGDQTISFDHNHRWWSEPAATREAWTSLPPSMTTISAGFTGRDGRSYLFSGAGGAAGPVFVRYTDPTMQRVDDRFPKPVKEYWGRVVSNLDRTGRVDAAVTLISTVTTTAADGTVTTGKQRYRYLFSGDQFYRYSSDGQPFADEGYPLRIQNNLRREPHFVNFDGPAERGIDGVWADTGNVFVFISGQMYVASVAATRQLDGLGVDEPRAADVEEGRLTIFGKNGWQHILPPEALAHAAEPALPRAVRAAPAPFQGKLSAILRGLDKNVYLFGDTQCYDRSLDRPYLTGAEWGKVRNHIADDERVDSALMGRDGILYLFRGDQFVSYTPAVDTPAQIPALADTTPSTVAVRWGGLNNVRHAFVQKGVTYLLEAPAEDGTFRYVRYFGTDYSRPNEPTPLSGDFSFWKIPADFVNRGFDRVDAVWSKGDILILIRDTRFIHYDAGTDTWTSSRPLSLLWPGLPHDHLDFATIRAAVSGPDDKTYFFSDGCWLVHDGERPSDLATISSRWAVLQNRITGSNRVDATFVHGEQTYLFSGDEYVRYTGSDYQYVDEGYPRLIAGLLRQETPFQQLPSDIETAFVTLKPEDVWVEAAFRTGGVVYVRAAGQTYALSAQLSRSYPLQQVTSVRNELLRRARVDAAFARRDGALLLLSGDQYVRYSGPDLDVVDDGYPRAISDGLLGELSAAPPALPLDFQFDLDAALLDSGGTLFLFKDKYFVQIDPNAHGGTLTPKEIKGVWGRVSNPFLASQNNPRPRIDAAFVAPDHALYLFQGGQYLRYADPSADRVDEGYPRAIRDRWGDLPTEFEGGIDTGFVFGGRTYLGRDKRYVRFSDPAYRLMDPTYPQLYTSRWRVANDFLLRDLRNIQRYVALDQSHPSDDASLTDFLLTSTPGDVDPYALLAALFDWEIADVQWLKRRDAFLDRPNRDLADETRFDIEQVLRIYDTLQLAGRLGSHPQELYEQVWSPLLVPPVQPSLAADTLERLLGTLYTGDDWTQIQRQLGDALSRLLRDAQVAWLLAHNSPQTLADDRDLSDLLLTDVEIDAIVDASPITEAIAAVQLYFHRYLTNLEPAASAAAAAAAPTVDDATRRATFKAQWQWIKNYRVWEANRKVFLYPESYIRPELRDTRTTAFKSLQDGIGQGEITDDSVTQAYKKYLDDYTEVSRLIIAGGYVQPDPANPADTELTIFGATRTDPPRYYYRTATFKNGDPSSTALWQAWQPLGIEIRSDRVYPVRAFGRTFVFWTEIEKNNPDSSMPMTLQTRTSGDTQQVSGQEQVEYQLKVLYSFHDLSEQWTPPQTLEFGATETEQIQAPDLRVSCMSGDDATESIVVNFQYSLNYAARLQAYNQQIQDAVVRKDNAAVAGLILLITQEIIALTRATPIRGAAQLTADLTVTTAQAVALQDRRVDLLAALFDPREAKYLEIDSVVMLGSAETHTGAPWYSFDLKGGSFLARPVEAASQTAEKLLPLKGNTEGLPQWDHVDACLDTSDGPLYLFDDRRMVYCAVGDLTEHPIGERWGLRYTRVLADGQVDAAWTRGNVLFLSRGDRYLKYSNGIEWADDGGDRGSAAERTADAVPQWSSINAAFTDKANRTWFFQGTKYVVLDDKNTLSGEADIKERWGHEHNEFTAPAAGPVVVAAFALDGRSFLIGPSSYTWYTDPALTLCEKPKPQSLRALLNELKCSNSGDVDEHTVVSGVVDSGTELLFKAGPGAENNYSLKDGKVTKTGDGPWQHVADFTVGDKKFVLAPNAAGDALTVSDGKDTSEIKQAVIKAALLGPGGDLYVFGVDRYLHINPNELNVAGIGNAIQDWAARSQPIADRWGWVQNAFTQGTVTGAFVRDDHAFLLSGDSYVRYSGTDYRVADEGYPRSLAGNPDGLPQVPVNAAVVGPDGRVCYFEGTHHVFGDALSAQIPNQSRWGRIRTNILVRGVDTAYRVGTNHYLFSGDEVASYTTGTDGKFPEYMDGPTVPAAFGSFSTVNGAFSYNGFLYLAGPDSFACCSADQPEQPLPGYPRAGQALALVADLRARFSQDKQASNSLAEGLEVFALSVDGSAILMDTDERFPGQRVIRFDLPSGQLTREWSPLVPAQIGFWAALRGGGSYVDLANARYSFRGDQVIKTGKGVAAAWGSDQTARSIADVWRSRPFDAAAVSGDLLYLFTEDHYCTLSTRDAKDDVRGAVVVQNIQSALGRKTPIRGGLTNLPEDLMDGFDAALESPGPLYVFKGPLYARLSTEAVRDEVGSLKYDLVRLTTSTAAQLNRALFVSGVPGLLSLRTQEVNETPGFSPTISTPMTICVNPARVNVDTLPLDGHLDFGSANGIYLWEIFFHAPMLIAGTLSTAQQFDQAKTWYEHIFDPTEPADAWKFLPFLTADVERIVIEFRDRLNQLEGKKVNTADLRASTQDLLGKLLAMDPAFQGERLLTGAELDLLKGYVQLPQVRQKIDALDLHGDPALEALRGDLRELVGLIEGLKRSWDGMQTSLAQIDTYLNDPFDPHAIAALRPIAYRKAIVMRYIENLLDWGDMLFSEYTRESIGEARMLYVLAWDLLGRRPESLGRKILPPDSAYAGLIRDARPGEYNLLLQLEEMGTPTEAPAQPYYVTAPITETESPAQPYFFIPPNEELDQYWTRVADRLYKIRHSLNILGVAQPLSLFEPPINPLDLVRAVAGAGGLAGLVDGAAGVDVPHYRFTFLMDRAQTLAQRVAQLGSDLLLALEKRDSEALSRLQATQEGVIYALTRDIQKAQLEEAKTNLTSLEQARANAQKRQEVYANWVDVGYLAVESVQIELLEAAVGINVGAAIFQILAALGEAVPKVHIGLFSFGTDTPELGKIFSNTGQALQTTAQVLQGVADVLGITAQHQRSVNDWTLQRDLAAIDLQQIDAQIEGAKWQIEGATRQITLTERQIAQNQEVSKFFREKFTNQELNEWMAGRLSGLHYQTYQLATSLARAAERAFQFERGTSQANTTFIQGQQWDSQRKGLLAGTTLTFDLDRMQTAFVTTDARRFEITKKISLVALDAMAFLKLKTDKTCEFDFTEALFDYDFPGHYCRQVKTIAADLTIGDDVFANATLTQLTNRVVMEPDAKAVGFLLAPKETPPLTIRTNWKAQQQIALSSHTQYETNSGVFDFRFDSERYLPFEGTGAVSRWRLELGGPPGAYDLRNLTDVTITLKYTALQGGDAFAASVRGLLKPTDVLRCFNLNTDFATEWQDFLQNDSDTLDLVLRPQQFPGMAGGGIRAIFSRYEYQTGAAGAASFVLNTDPELPLPDGKTVDTSGLTVRAAGTTLSLRLKGDKSTLSNVYLVMGYKGGV